MSDNSTAPILDDEGVPVVIINRRRRGNSDRLRHQGADSNQSAPVLDEASVHDNGAVVPPKKR